MKIQLSPQCEKESNETVFQDKFYVGTDFIFILTWNITFYYFFIFEKNYKLFKYKWWEIFFFNKRNNSKPVQVSQKNEIYQSGHLVINKFATAENKGDCKLSTCFAIQDFHFKSYETVTK